MKPFAHPTLAKRNRGFTLIELLVVITLLAIITTLGIASYEGVQDESKVDVTKYEMQELKKALLQFRADNRAFPCGVYNEQERPYEPDVNNMVYANLPAGNLPAKQAWCEGNGVKENGLQMLMKFPFDVSDTLKYTGDLKTLHPLWNPDTKRGWRGPYLSSVEGMKDAWGKYYYLIDPELDFPAYESSKQWCGLDATNSFYECQIGPDAAHDKPGNSARIVSYGEDGQYGGDNLADICLPNATEPASAGNDDLVVCLTQ